MQGVAPQVKGRTKHNDVFVQSMRRCQHSAGGTPTDQTLNPHIITKENICLYIKKYTNIIRAQSFFPPPHLPKTTRLPGDYISRTPEEGRLTWVTGSRSWSRRSSWGKSSCILSTSLSSSSPRLTSWNKGERCLISRRSPHLSSSSLLHYFCVLSGLLLAGRVPLERHPPPRHLRCLSS